MGSEREQLVVESPSSAGTVNLSTEVVRSEGRSVVLLHGLTATRRYVVMGSNFLQRKGFNVVAYDARGHGESTPAPSPDLYGYTDLAIDLKELLDFFGIRKATLTGASMGAHTAIRFALSYPERVSSLVLATPAFDPDVTANDQVFEQWDRRAEALEDNGIEGFIEAFNGYPQRREAREVVEKVIRQRLARHANLQAIADALRVVPRSRPFESWGDLAKLHVPVSIVGSRDEFDPEHPLKVAKKYHEAIVGSRLVVENEGMSPLAWQGAQLSRVVMKTAYLGASS